MMGRTLKEGRYPAEEGEAALDEFTLRNLDIPREIGTTFTLDGETFTLCGIVSEQPSALTQRMQVFVDPTRDYGTNGRFLYVKFEESKDIYRQMSAFADTFGISKKEIAANWELVGVGSRFTAGKLPPGSQPLLTSCSCRRTHW